jgi:uncharacterized membrane protein
MPQADLDLILVLDVVAPLWLLLCWVAYGWFADHRPGSASLMRTMHAYRRRWMESMLGRDNRMVDVQIIGNLMRSTTFFASTMMFIVGGLIAVLGARAEAMAVLRELPFAVDASPLLWEIKVLLLMVLFVYAFFKFTWAVRHYTHSLTLLGSVPGPEEVDDEIRHIAACTADVVTATARHFNHGMRACYFGLATLTWLLHPALFIIATSWVVVVLYRREFHSRLIAQLPASAGRGPAL